MIFFTIIIGSRPWYIFLCIFQSGFNTLERNRILQHFFLFLFPMLFLNLFDDIIVIELVLFFWSIFKPLLSNTKSWLLDDEVRIFLFFFDDFG